MKHALLILACNIKHFRTLKKWTVCFVLFLFQLPWPRTVTERLLDEMFDSTASRFLAVLEALSDSNRRTLQTGPIVTDEVEVRDVVSELFMAGKELLISK